MLVDAAEAGLVWFGVAENQMKICFSSFSGKFKKEPFQKEVSIPLRFGVPGEGGGIDIPVRCHGPRDL